MKETINGCHVFNEINLLDTGYEENMFVKHMMGNSTVNILMYFKKTVTLQKNGLINL